LETSTKEHLDKMGGFYDQAIEQNKTSAAQVKKNLETQTAQFNTWIDNIKKLAPRIPKALLDELMKIGPESTKLIQDLNASTPAELDDFVRVWSDKAKAARTAATFELGQLPADISNVVNGINSTLQNTSGISEGARYIGGQIVDGINAGMKARYPLLKDTVSGMPRDILSGLRAGFEIHSPSKATMRIGAYLPEGLGIGIRSNMGAAIRQAGAMVTGTLAQFKNMQKDLRAPALQWRASPIAGMQPAMAGGPSLSDSGARAAAQPEQARKVILEIPVNLNGREIARASVDDMDRELANRELNRSRGGGR
jgi:phage-related protein